MKFEFDKLEFQKQFNLLYKFNLRVRLVHVFKNWKLVFENIYENTCGWKSALKYVKCCLKTKNDCLKSQTKFFPKNVLFTKFFQLSTLYGTMLFGLSESKTACWLTNMLPEFPGRQPQPEGLGILFYFLIFLLEGK